MHPFPVSIPRRRWLRGASTLAAAALCAPALRAQSTYPSRPIKIIVPFSAGGTTDILARELAIRFTDKWKVSVVAENKAGAGGGHQFSPMAVDPLVRRVGQRCQILEADGPIGRWRESLHPGL